MNKMIKKLPSVIFVVTLIGLTKAFPSPCEGPTPIFNRDRSYGYVDMQGVVKIPFEFLKARRFSDGLAAVKNRDGFWGYIDTTGKYIIRPVYSYATSFSEGIAFVKSRETGKMLAIDSNGNQYFSGDFSSVKGFSDGLAAVRIGKKWAFVDKKGNFAVKPKFRFVESFSMGLAYVEINTFPRPIGFYIDRNGKRVFGKNFQVRPRIEIQVTSHSFRSDRAVFYENGKYGYIDSSGKIVIPATYALAKPFFEGKAVVFSSFRDGIVIDPRGTRVFVGNFRPLGNFSDSLMFVEQGGSFFYVNQNGQRLNKESYVYATSFMCGSAFVHFNEKSGGKFAGLINREGEVFYSFRIS